MAITELKVGNEAQIPIEFAIPGTAFAVSGSASKAAWYNVPLLQIKMVSPGQAVTLTGINISGAPIRMLATLFGHCSDTEEMFHKGLSDEEITEVLKAQQARQEEQNKQYFKERFPYRCDREGGRLYAHPTKTRYEAFVQSLKDSSTSVHVDNMYSLDPADEL